jgi:hypothetical protein
LSLARQRDRRSPGTSGVELRIQPAYCAVGAFFQRAIGADQFPAEDRQLRSATVRAAGGSSNHGLVEAGVQVVQQQPGASVAELQFPGGLRQRTAVRDGFQQIHLARANGMTRGEINAQSRAGRAVADHRQIQG